MTNSHKTLDGVQVSDETLKLIYETVCRHYNSTYSWQGNIAGDQERAKAVHDRAGIEAVRSVLRAAPVAAQPAVAGAEPTQTAKEAWWSGARAGAGLPSDATRDDVRKVLDANHKRAAPQASHQPAYTHADVTDAHAKGYKLGLAQKASHQLAVAIQNADEVDERTAFESWADDQGFLLKRVDLGDEYLDLRTQGPWEAWRARAALSRSADAVDARKLWETIKILGLSNDKLALQAINAVLSHRADAVASEVCYEVAELDAPADGSAERYEADTKRALQLARKFALIEGQREGKQHSYLPWRAEKLEDWEPHDWVIKAIMAAMPQPAVATDAQEVEHEPDKVAESALSSDQPDSAKPAFHGFMDEENCCVHLCFTPHAPRADGTYATAYYTSAKPARKGS